MNTKPLNLSVLFAAALMLAAGVAVAADAPTKAEVATPAATHAPTAAKPDEAPKHPKTDTAASGTAKPETAPATAASFDSLDRNHDGALSADEAVELKGTEFARRDTNKDGKLSREEFTAALPALKAPVDTPKKS